MSSAIGRPVERLGGRQKVTGAGARYAGEIPLPHLTYAATVGATIPSGRVTAIDTARAAAAGGVLAFLTHEDLPKVAAEPRLLPPRMGATAPGESFFPMQDEVVHYAGQPVAIVVADSHERARHAAALVDVTYERTPSTTAIGAGRDTAYEAEKLFGGLMPGLTGRGDVDAALWEAEVRIDVAYRCAANANLHNGLDLPTTTAVWDEDRLTIYDTTMMGVRASRLTVARLLGIPASHVRVLSQFAGGGIRSNAMVWPRATLAALAARHVGRPVKLALTRPRTGTSDGDRQEQTLALGATRDGRLTALRHDKVSMTSLHDDWAGPATGASSQIDACPSFLLHRLVRGDTMTPTFTRGPGETLGTVLLESAMDELASRLRVDPIELRVRNHAAVDASGNPWSSDGLEECLRRGAERFGWAERDPEPRARREGRWLVGSGIAAAAYPVALFMPAQHARARMYADGGAVVQTGSQEYGTGAMTQVAADGLGIRRDSVRFEAGDSDLPNTSAAAGSAGARMVRAAVHAATTALRDQLVAAAVADARSPLSGADPAAVDVRNGRMALRERPHTGETYGELLQRNHVAIAEAPGSWTPPPMDTPHGLMTFGAQFAEVAVDPELGLVRVRRMVGAFAPGRVLDPRTARRRLMGGMLCGLGQALGAGSRMDPRLGRRGATDPGDHLGPVNADAPAVTVEFVEVHDEVVNPLGVNSVGEIGQVGVAAAIVNAVFHATGRRVRELPLTPELLRDPSNSTRIGW